jgi:DNA-directed RNA polymerase subunit alpha
VQHEITTIPGVVEDVTDIILNVKSLVVKNTSEQPKTIRIDRHERGVVTAANIITDESVQIINPEHILATLTDDVPFLMEMTVENGRGYRTADENAGREREIGVIPVDSSFSPVVRVKYEIEDTRVGQRTNYDKLIMEIWTNGTTSPSMAMVEAAKILRKHLNTFVQYYEVGRARVSEAAAAAASVDDAMIRKMNTPVSELELSVRASNCLESAKIATVAQLVSKSESDLLKVRSFGKTSLREVKKKLQDMGLALGMPLPEGVQV